MPEKGSRTGRLRREYENVLRSIDIRDVVGHYTLVAGTGRQAKALCPFHDDNNPSMGFWTGKDGIERFKCFVCGESGDAFDFVYRYETKVKRRKFSFEEAIEKAAEIGGIDVSVRKRVERPIPPETAGRDFQARVYEYYIHTEPAREYILHLADLMGIDRNATPEAVWVAYDVAERCGLGWVPSKEKTESYFRNRPGIRLSAIPPEGPVTIEKDDDGHVRRFNPEIFYPKPVNDTLYLCETKEDVLVMSSLGIDACLSVSDLKRNIDRVASLSDSFIVTGEEPATCLSRAGMLASKGKKVKVIAGAPAKQIEKGISFSEYLRSDLYPPEMMLLLGNRQMAEKVAQSPLMKERIAMLEKAQNTNAKER